MRNNIKSYSVTYGAGEIELSVEIDFSKLPISTIKEYAQNHHDYESYLKFSDNDVVCAFLKLLAKTCFRLCIEKDLNAQGVIEEFEPSRGLGLDLFPSMSGKEGIKIKSFHFDELDPSLFECCVS